MANIATPPVQYPTVIIDGKTYSLKLHMGALYQLEEQGVDIGQLSALFSPTSKSRITLIFKLAASMLGTVDEQGRWHSWHIEPLALADLVPREDFQALSQAVVQAIAKVQPATPGQAPPAEAEARPS